jgi:O-methyltransferase involved in polyketide biosynthesis
MSDLRENTVQHTLCIPLYGRMVAAEKYPDLVPDKDAGRIVRELGMDFSGEKICRVQYMWMNALIRQYNLAWEIDHYLDKHPRTAVVELGAGLSCLRWQIRTLFCCRFNAIVFLGGGDRNSIESTLIGV